MLKIKGIIKHTVIQNAIALYWVQIANFILSFITVPYLSRILGPSQWGKVIFAQSFAIWCSLFIEYGFQLSASRELARNRDYPDKVAQLVASIHGVKILFVLLSVFIAIISYFLVPFFHTNRIFLIGAWLLCVAQGANPFWFFQGIEKLKLPSIINIIAQVISVCAIFILIQTPDDAWKVLFIQSICLFLSFGFCIGWMYSQTVCLIPGIKDIWQTIKLGWSMFLFRASTSLYTSANSFILGLFVTPAIVSFYGSAQKISQAAIQLLLPMSLALYPRINHLMISNPKKSKKIAIMSLTLFLAAGLLMGLLIILIAPIAIRLILGPQYMAVVPVLRILAILVPLIAVSNVLGIQWMLPNNMDTIFNKTIIGAGLLNIVLAVFLAPIWKAEGMAIAVVISEAFVTFSMFGVLKFKKMEIWRY